MPALSHARDLRSDATRILTLTTLQQIGLTMVRFGLPVLLPFMREDLRLSVLQVAIVLTALDLGSLVAFIPAGLITDRWGERRVLVSGGLLMGVVAAATALAPSLAFLLIGLAIAGLGFPSGHTAGTKLVVRRFAPQARGLALGIRMSGLPAGGALAALLIPSLAGMWGWRGALAVIGGLCALVAALCLFLPRDREVPGHPLPTALAPLRALVAEPRYVHLTAMGALLVIGQFTLQGFLALFLVDRYGWAPSDAGRLLAVVHVGGVAGRLLWGAISDRAAHARRTPVLLWVLAGGIAVLLGLSSAPIGVHLWLALGTAFAGGAFLAGWNALFMNLVTEHAGVLRAATAIGGTLTAMYLSTMASYPLFGAVAQATHSYTPAWLLVTACQGIALFLLVRVRER